MISRLKISCTFYLIQKKQITLSLNNSNKQRVIGKMYTTEKKLYFHQMYNAVAGTGQIKTKNVENNKKIRVWKCLK